MKSLSLKTPKILVLVGIPGAGKTFFAEKFSDTFSAPYIDTAVIRHTVTENPDYSNDEQTIVDTLAKQQLHELMKTKKTILFEGGTHVRADRLRLAKQAKDAGYETLLVWIQTEPNTARARATRKARGKNKMHTISEERYEHIVSKFTAPNDSEETVVLSGKHTYATQAKAVLKRLVEPREDTPIRSEAPLTPPARKTTNSRGQITIQ